MEMNDQILQHIMNVQTQLLQQMVKLQQEQNDTIARPATIVSPTATGAFGTPLPGTIASPVTPPPLQGMAQPGMPFLSVNDPTRYGTFAAPYPSDGSRPILAAQSGFKNFISGTINEMTNFDPTQQSKESTEQHFARQSRGVQEQAVNVLGGAINGATSIGTFMIPGGLAASLAVGGVVGAGVGIATNAMVNGAKTALDYQDLLQQKSYKFINAFESTSDIGGIGMGLSQRQEVSGFMRDLATDKFLDSGEMMKILDGAADNNLLKSVSDVNSFKKKFTEIVDTVKSITVTMNQTIEEATNFMGEMERRGISTKDMGLISAQSKVLSSFLGISASQGSQLLMQTSDSIVQGTGLDPTKIIGSAAENTFYASQIMDDSKKNDPALYHYIKNNGGDSAVGAQFEQLSRGYVNGGQGKSNLLNLFASGYKLNEDTGEMEVDKAAMDSLLKSNLSYDQLRDLSMRATSKLTDAQRFQLSENAGVLFNDYASSQQSAEFLKRNVDVLMKQQKDQGSPIDEKTALSLLGIATDAEQAKYIQARLDSPDMTPYYKARVFKEEQDSQNIADSPGIKKRFNFWWDRTFTNPLGDVGQGVSDGIGRGMQDYQKFITGIEDSSVLGGNQSLQSFDQKGLNQVLKQSKGLIDENRLFSSNYGNVFNETLDQGTYNSLMSQVQKGEINPEDLPKILKNSTGFSKGLLSNWRASMLEGEATGEYDGFFGRLSYYKQAGALGTASFVDKHLGFLTHHDDVVKLVGSDNENTLDEFKKQQKSIMSTKKDLNEQMTKLMLDGGLGTTDPEELEKIKKAIKKGDLAEVRLLTDNNRDAANLADKYISVNKKTDSYKEDMENFEPISRYTASMAQSGNQLAGLLSASKTLDKGEINSLLGDFRKKSKEIREQIKDGTISATGMAQFDKDALAQIDDIFDMLPKSDLNNFAAYLQKKDPNAQLLGKNGSLDVDKLKDYVMNDVLRNEHITEPNKDSKSKSKSSSDENTKAATKAAQDHEQAMYQFLLSYQQETQMLKDTIAGRPITNSNQTSIGTR
jgi:hypothetical protein